MFAGKKSAQIREILISESAWEEMTCLFAPSLTVFVDNAPAIKVYKKYGFEIEGTGKKYALRNGEYVDAYYMARVK